MYVDALFSQFVHGLPFDPGSADESKRLFVERAGVRSWEELVVVGAEREVG